MSKKKKVQKALTGVFVLTLLLPSTFASASTEQKSSGIAQKVHSKAGQPVIEAVAKDILTINGKQYKDLNGNGKLDRYENWELSVDKRVKDLISKMTLEEKAGLMLISDTKINANAAEGESLLVEEDQWDQTNMFSSPGQPNYEFEHPVLMRSGSTKGILDRNLRYFIGRQTLSADTMSNWTNRITRSRRRFKTWYSGCCNSKPSESY